VTRNRWEGLRYCSQRRREDEKQVLRIWKTKDTKCKYYVFGKRIETEYKWKGKPLKRLKVSGFILIPMTKVMGWKFMTEGFNG